MRIVRFEINGTYFYGSLTGSEIDIIEGDIFGDYSLSGRKLSVNSVKILPPCIPSKAVCVGLNYKDHIKEMGLDTPSEPTLFIKPDTSVIGHLDYIEYPEMSKRVDHECELVVVIKKIAKNVRIEDSRDYILGYTCGNDVTARDLQPKAGQWTVSKSFDTFLPLGPWIETSIDPSNLDIKTYLNGEIKQTSNTRNLLFDVYNLVSYISRIMTLKPGDIIMTGTPSGVSPMKHKDRVEVEIEGIGKLTNYIK
jgi:2-keto-4-pentenoate hydratase/2-oxohepta-3-ene-1,7-dioic acid hydratase (catechol pathway)